MAARNDPLAGYQAATQGVVAQAITTILNLYGFVAPSPYQQAMIQFLQVALPHIMASRKAVANLTSVQIASRTGTPAIAALADEGRGVAETYARPFITRHTALLKGMPEVDATELGARQLSGLLTTDAQMAKVTQAQASLKSAGVTHYQRIAEGDNPCELCLLASTQVYNTDSLMPIHTSCCASGSLVTAPSGLQAVMRREYVGEIVELVTASGNELRVTPNHPVLTEHGWVAAGLIRQGDNVFHSLRGERNVGLGESPDIAKHPTRIEDVFAATRMVDLAVTHMPITAQDFHGDGTDGEVDIVWTDRDLAPVRHLSKIQQPGELCLMHRHRLRQVALAGSGPPDQRLSGVPRTPPGGVGRGHHLAALLGRALGGGEVLSLAPGANRNAPAPQLLGNSLGTNPSDGVALRKRLAGQIESDRVVELRQVNSSSTGHVYNLQTVDGWFISSGIVVHNCQCDIDILEPGYDVRQIDVPPEMLFKEDGSDRNTKFTQYLKGISDQNAASTYAKAYQNLVEVKPTELGPTLTWKGGKSISPPPGLANRPVVTRGGVPTVLAVQRPQELVEAWAAMHPGFPLDMSGFHPVNITQERAATLMVRDYLQGVDDILTKYPILQENPWPITWGGMQSSHHAAETWRGSRWGTTSKMTLNPEAFADPAYLKHAHDEWLLTEGGTNRFGRIQRDLIAAKDRPWGYTAGVHEMGHAMSNLTSGQTEAEVESIMLREFATRTAAAKGVFDVRDMNSWLDTEMSGYAAGGMGFRGINQGEAIAEAFADVEANGANATQLSKAIHQALVESAGTRIGTQSEFALAGLVKPQSFAKLDREVYDLTRANGGVTIDLGGNKPAIGYAYAPTKGTEVVVREADFTPAHVDRFIDEHFDDLSKPGNHLGIWTQDGNVYLDVSKVGPPTAETLATAQAANQLAVFDLEKFHDINLGTLDADGRYAAIGTPTDLHAQYRGQVEGAVESGSATGALDLSGGAAAGVTKPAAGELKWQPNVGKRQTTILARGEDWDYRIVKKDGETTWKMARRPSLDAGESWHELASGVSLKDAKSGAAAWEASGTVPKNWIPGVGTESTVLPVGPVPAGARELSKAKTIKDVEDIFNERHPTIETYGFTDKKALAENAKWGYNPDPKIVRDFMSGVDSQLVRYPGIRLQQVGIGTPGGGAFAETATSYKLAAQGVTERVTVDRWSVSDTAGFRESSKKMQKPEKWSGAKYGHQFPTKTPAYDAGVHEMAHVLNNSLKDVPAKELSDFLRGTYLEQYAEKLVGKTAEETAAMYGDWLRDNLPGYARVYKTNMDSGEALAVAWADSRALGKKSDISVAVQSWLDAKAAPLEKVEKPSAAKPPVKKALKKLETKPPAKKGVNQRASTTPKKASTPNLPSRNRVSALAGPKTEGLRPPLSRVPTLPDAAPSLSEVAKLRATKPNTQEVLKTFTGTDLIGGKTVYTANGTIDKAASWAKIDLKDLKANMRAALKESPDWATRVGWTWYPEVTKWADGLVDTYHDAFLARTGIELNRERMAVIIARYSANNSWLGNQIGVEKFLMNTHAGKDFHIADTWEALLDKNGVPREHPLAWLSDGSPKEWNFAGNINGDRDASAVDRWMSRILFHSDDDDLAGKLLGAKTTSKYAATNNYGYDKLQQAINEVADELGLPHDVAQAIPWIGLVGPDATIVIPGDMAELALHAHPLVDAKAKIYEVLDQRAMDRQLAQVAAHPEGVGMPDVSGKRKPLKREGPPQAAAPIPDITILPPKAAPQLYRGLVIKSADLPKPIDQMTGTELLDHLNQHEEILFGKPKTKGLGQHWTTKESLANEVTHQPSKGDVRIVLTADRPPGDFQAGSFKTEHEIVIPPNTPINVNGIAVSAKRTGPLEPLSLEPLVRDPLLDLLDPVGGGKHVPYVETPKAAAPLPPAIPGVPRGEENWYKHLTETENAAATAHLTMTTELLDYYKEYERPLNQAKTLRKVVAEQGIRRPLWISTDGTHAILVEGNNRLAVAKDLGLTNLPVRVTFDPHVLANEGTPVPLDPVLKKWIADHPEIRKPRM